MTVWKGFKFGMLLQLAIGPVCIFILTLAANQGFLVAEQGVAAVALVDALYILCALLGMVTFIEKENTKRIFQYIGGLVVMAYGIQTITGVAGWEILPGFNLFSGFRAHNPFLEGFILTASNPITILFWAGVLSAKVAEANFNRKDTYRFSFGCVLATLFFLTLVALTGSVSRYFLPAIMVRLLNVLVGVFLLYFSIKMMVKKDKVPV